MEDLGHPKTSNKGTDPQAGVGMDLHAQGAGRFAGAASSDFMQPTACDLRVLRFIGFRGLSKGLRIHELCIRMLRYFSKPPPTLRGSIKWNMCCATLKVQLPLNSSQGFDPSNFITRTVWGVGASGLRLRGLGFKGLGLSI